jgi:YHS domain-containing protein
MTVLLRTLLFFLLGVFLVRAAVRLIGGIVQGASGGAQARHQPTQPAAVKMMRDPVCGTYVVPGKALELARGRETLYFCSEKCREQYYQKS